MKHSILAYASVLSILFGNCLAQKSTESKPAAEKTATTVEPLSAVQLEQLLNTRLDVDLQFNFKQFANMFLVSSRISMGTNVGLMTKSQIIAETDLQPIYPSSYHPTLREFLDRIALQTSATWKYDPTGQFVRDTTGQKKPLKDMAIFEFSENKKIEKPYEMTLEKGWKTVDKGHWVMHVPKEFPIGMDIYQMGTYSPEKGEVTPEFINKTRLNISLTWAQRVRPETKSKDLITTKVGSYEALYFESMTKSQLGEEIKWRQWVFFVGNEAYFIVSTILPEFEDKIFPDVKKMISTFQKRNLDQGGAVNPANPPEPKK
jgi:hypothetical protein